MVRDLDFLIYYEIVEREYENSLLIKFELEKRGYSVALCNTVKADYWHAWLYRPKVVLCHTLRNNRNVHSYTQYLNWHVHKIIDLQYEQVLGRSYVGSDSWIPQGCAKKALHICWGRNAARRLKKGGVSEENIAVTGALQMDTLHHNFKEYYKDKVNLGLAENIDPTKKWVLFNANFPILSVSKSSFMAKKIASRVDSLDSYINVRARIQSLILKWAEELLDSDKEIIFIYRPHPGEQPTNAVKDLLRRNNRFIWNGSLSVKQWIVVSDVVCVWNSSSIIEAYYAGKPAIILRPVECKDNYDVFLFDDARAVTNYRDFYHEIKNATFENFPISVKKIEDYYGKKESELAYIKVCDVLERVYHDKKFNHNFNVHLKPSYFFRESKFRLISFYVFFVRHTGIKLTSLPFINMKPLINAEKYAEKYTESNLFKTYEEPLKKVFDSIS